MPSGFLLIDKDAGVTCRHIDNHFQHLFSCPTGHLGTLDPFATGLLVLAIGDATKLLPIINDSYKTYVATLKFGVETDTLDSLGQITNTADVPVLNEEKITKVLKSFIGITEQTPPRYSAKQIAGKRAYDLAREGQAFQLKPIKIDVESIKLISFSKDEIAFEVSISKGGYIRSLGRDIATKLNTVGHLISLRRTKVGKLSISQCKHVAYINAEDLIKMNDFFPDIPTVEIESKLLKRVSNGADIKLNQDSEFIFISHFDQLLALYKKVDDHYHCYKGFQHEH